MGKSKVVTAIFIVAAVVAILAWLGIKPFWIKDNANNGEKETYITESYNQKGGVTAGKIDKYVVLCQEHYNHTYAEYPELRDKLYLSSNGIRTDLIIEAEKSGPYNRNPSQLIWTSSPDRGLDNLLKIFQRVKS